MLNQTPPQHVLQIAATISRYLEQRPQALDSLDGIQRWWLLRQHIEESKEMVQAAIDYLVSNGQVEQIKSNDRTFYTSVHRDKLDDAGDMLTKTS